MTLSIDQLKAAFGQTDKKEGGSSRPSNYYPFWKMNDGQQAVVRFLPDKDPENSLGFLVEKRTHVLSINGENKTVPCPTMYDEECPICKLSSEYYSKEDKVNGKKYWRKKQHIAQAIIVEDPLPVDDDTGENHEGQVRFIALGYQLFNIIKDAFESGELDEVPFAYEGGTDFIIKKSKQGEYSTYALGSKFARKSRDLDDDEIANAQEHMVELKTMLPEMLPDEKLNSMLLAATGQATSYDDSDSDSGTSSIAAAVAESKPAPAATPAAETASSDDDGDDEADKLLAAIRSRRAKKAE